MAKEIYPVGTNKEMVVEKDVDGNLISVKDEKGNPAKTVERNELKIKWGDKELEIIEVSKGACFVTKHNPTCCWYFIAGKWYYICTG